LGVISTNNVFCLSTPDFSVDSHEIFIRTLYAETRISECYNQIKKPDSDGNLEVRRNNWEDIHRLDRKVPRQHRFVFQVKQLIWSDFWSQIKSIVYTNFSVNIIAITNQGLYILKKINPYIIVCHYTRFYIRLAFNMMTFVLRNQAFYHRHRMALSCYAIILIQFTGELVEGVIYNKSYTVYIVDNFLLYLHIY